MFGLQFLKRQDDFTKDIMSNVNSLYGSALRMTRNPADAEDLLQDTMLKAYKSKKTFNEGTNLRAWIFKILVNTFINQYHKKKKEQATFNKNYDFSEIEERYVDEWSKSNFAAQRLPFTSHMSDEVCTAFEELPENFRLVVEMADLHDFSYIEISKILDCPMGTVMSRLSRGRKMLQTALHEYALKEGIIKSTVENAENNSGLSEVVSITDAKELARKSS